MNIPKFRTHVWLTSALFQRQKNSLKTTTTRQASLYAGLIVATTIPLLDATALTKSTLAEETTLEFVSTHEQTIYVNPQTGDDAGGEGSENSPLKTITHALSIAAPKTIIFLAPGTYNAETGENFPLLLKTDVTLRGNPNNRGQDVIIEGSGLFLSPTAAKQNVAIAATREAGGITGVTVTNPKPRGHGIWIESASPKITHSTLLSNGSTGISVNGSSNPLIANSYFSDNNGNGILVYGTSKPEIRDNEIEGTGYGISVTESAHPTLIGNRISGNRVGVILEGESGATLRKNTIENSQDSGLVAIAGASADLGTTAEPGGNIFLNNRGLDVRNLAENEGITAVGNQLSGATEGKIEVNSTGTNQPVQQLSQPVPANNLSSADQEVVTDSTSSGRLLPPSVSNTPTSVAQDATESSPSPKPEGVSIAVPAPDPSPAVNSNVLSSSNPLPPPPVPSTPTPTAISPATEVDNSETETSSLPSTATPRSLTDVMNVSSRFPRQDQSRLPVPQPPAVDSSVETSQQKYKVVVKASNSSQETEVRSLYPEAFTTVHNGQDFLQIGVFSRRDNAEEALQALKDLGLSATMVQL